MIYDLRSPSAAGTSTIVRDLVGSYTDREVVAWWSTPAGRRYPAVTFCGPWTVIGDYEVEEVRAGTGSDRWRSNDVTIDFVRQCRGRQILVEGGVTATLTHTLMPDEDYRIRFLIPPYAECLERKIARVGCRSTKGDEERYRRIRTVAGMFPDAKLFTTQEEVKEDLR